jgi:hypothetical protein
MSRPYQGQAPKGASVTSGTVSAGTAITAAHIDINGFAFPAVALAASAAARVDQLIALINSAFTITGVWAEKVTSVTYKLTSGAAITATLGASATVATFGFVTSISDPLDAQVLLASGNRVKFGSGLVTGDDAYINYGSQDINVKHAKAMGLLGVAVGADIELTPAADPTAYVHSWVA